MKTFSSSFQSHDPFIFRPWLFLRVVLIVIYSFWNLLEHYRYVYFIYIKDLSAFPHLAYQRTADNRPPSCERTRRKLRNYLTQNTTVNIVSYNCIRETIESLHFAQMLIRIIWRTTNFIIKIFQKLYWRWISKYSRLFHN